MHSPGVSRRENADACSNVIARSQRVRPCGRPDDKLRDEAIHSFFLCGGIDFFGEPVIGRAFARPVGSQ
jgi:hypothetical protein